MNVDQLTQLQISEAMQRQLRPKTQADYQVRRETFFDMRRKFNAQASGKGNRERMRRLRQMANGL